MTGSLQSQCIPYASYQTLPGRAHAQPCLPLHIPLHHPPTHILHWEVGPDTHSPSTASPSAHSTMHHKSGAHTLPRPPPVPPPPCTHQALDRGAPGHTLQQHRQHRRTACHCRQLRMVADVLHGVRAQGVVQGDRNHGVGVQGRVDQDPLWQGRHAHGKGGKGATIESTTSRGSRIIAILVQRQADGLLDKCRQGTLERTNTEVEQTWSKSAWLRRCCSRPACCPWPHLCS